MWIIGLFLLLFITYFVHHMSLIVLNTDIVISSMPIVIWRNWLQSMTTIGYCPKYTAWILMFTLSITNLTMDKCPTCTRHVSLHAKQIRGCVCQENYHMECISLRADHAHTYSNADTRYYPKCLSEICPFDQINDEDMFVLEVNQLDVCTRTIQSLTEILFNPFELNDDHYCPLNAVDPFARYWISILVICLVMVHFFCFIWTLKA